MLRETCSRLKGTPGTVLYGTLASGETVKPALELENFSMAARQQSDSFHEAMTRNSKLKSRRSRSDGDA